MSEPIDNLADVFADDLMAIVMRRLQVRIHAGDRGISVCLVDTKTGLSVIAPINNSVAFDVEPMALPPAPQYRVKLRSMY